MAQAVRTGLGLKAEINLPRSSTGKTISILICHRAIRFRQSRTRSWARARSLSISDSGRARHTVGIERLAPGAGRRQDPSTISIRRHSYVDLNRSGVALMEIVSKPDMRSSEEAQAYVIEAAHDLALSRALATAIWSRAILRADVNVSVRKPGEQLGTRCEIKNVNSIRFIGQAIEVEARRQIEIIEDGGTIDQETRSVDPGPAKRAPCGPRKRRMIIAISLIPTLLPLELTQAYVDELAAGLPELPDEKRARFIAELWADAL